MGVFKKKEKKQSQTSILDIHTRLEIARRNLAQRKQQVQQQNDSCVSIQQDLVKITEECATLQEKNRKHWRRTVVLCLLFFLLGAGINAGMFLYAEGEAREYAQNLEQEYNTKRADMEQKLSEEQP